MEQTEKILCVEIHKAKHICELLIEIEQIVSHIKTTHMLKEVIIKNITEIKKILGKGSLCETRNEEILVLKEGGQNEVTFINPIKIKEEDNV